MDMIMNEEEQETGDFIVNEKEKQVHLTAQGVEKVEKFFQIDNLADMENQEIQHNIILALRAHNLMFRDKDYMVKDNEGHGFSNEENRFDFYRQLEEFFRKHLGLR